MDLNLKSNTIACLIYNLYFPSCQNDKFYCSFWSDRINSYFSAWISEWYHQILKCFRDISTKRDKKRSSHDIRLYNNWSIFYKNMNTNSTHLLEHSLSLKCIQLISLSEREFDNIITQLLQKPFLFFCKFYMLVQ